MSFSVCNSAWYALRRFSKSATRCNAFGGSWPPNVPTVPWPCTVSWVSLVCRLCLGDPDAGTLSRRAASTWAGVSDHWTLGRFALGGCAEQSGGHGAESVDGLDTGHWVWATTAQHTRYMHCHNGFEDHLGNCMTELDFNSKSSDSLGCLHFSIRTNFLTCQTLGFFTMFIFKHKTTFDK